MNIRWTQYAVDQLDVLVDNLVERRGVEAVKQTTDRLFQRVQTLSDLPWSGPEWVPAQDETFRRLIVDEYVVLYRVDKLQQRVFVLAIRHGRQRPLDPIDVPKT